MYWLPDLSPNFKIVLLDWHGMTRGRLHSLFKIKIRLDNTIEWLLWDFQQAIPELTSEESFVLKIVHLFEAS